MSRVVVLGASGFLGTHVVNELVARDHDVLAVTLVPPPAEVRPRVSWHQIDLDRSFEPVVFDAPVCVHLAEPAAIAAAAEGEASLARARRVLAGGFTRIVYASSAVVYGDRVAAPRREAEPATPFGTYAVAKLAVETLVAADPRCLAIRVGNAYGPGMSSRNVLSDILGQLHAAGPLAVRDLSPVRDYVHVTDIARAFVAAAMSTVVGVLNVATGRADEQRDRLIVLERQGEQFVHRRSGHVLIDFTEQRQRAVLQQRALHGRKHLLRRFFGLSVVHSYLLQLRQFD